MATIEAIESFFDWNIWRAMCRCVTCAISCPSTPASSDSFCAATIKPVWTPMKPPGIAKALMLGSAMGKEIEAEARVAADGDEAAAELIEVSLDVRIVKIAGLARADLVHDLLADSLLERK